MTPISNNPNLSSSSSKPSLASNPISDVVNYTIKAMSAHIPSRFSSSHILSIAAQTNPPFAHTSLPVPISPINSTSSNSSTSLTGKKSSSNTLPAISSSNFKTNSTSFRSNPLKIRKNDSTIHAPTSSSSSNTNSTSSRSGPLNPVRVRKNGSNIHAPTSSSSSNTNSTSSRSGPLNPVIVRKNGSNIHAPISSSSSNTNSTSLRSSPLNPVIVRKNDSNIHAESSSSSTTSTLATIAIISSRFERMSNDLIYAIVQFLPVTDITIVSRLNHSLQSIIRYQLQRNSSNIQPQINLTRCIDLYASLKIIGLQPSEITSIFTNKRYTVFFHCYDGIVNPNPGKNSLTIYDDLPDERQHSERNQKLALNSSHLFPNASSIFTNIPIPEAIRKFERASKDKIIQHFQTLSHSEFSQFLEECLARRQCDKWMRICELPNFFVTTTASPCIKSGRIIWEIHDYATLQSTDIVTQPLEKFLTKHKNTEPVIDEFVDFVYQMDAFSPYLSIAMQTHYAQRHFSINEMFDRTYNPYHKQFFMSSTDESSWQSILDARRVDLKRIFS